MNGISRDRAKAKNKKATSAAANKQVNNALHQQCTAAATPTTTTKIGRKAYKETSAVAVAVIAEQH